MPEDDMDVDEPQQRPQSSAVTHDTLDDFPHSPSRKQVPVESHSEGCSATDPSFHSAREELTKRDVMVQEPQKDLPMTEDLGAMKQSAEQQSGPSARTVIEDAIDVDAMDRDLDQDLVDDESRSPSQGSSPARTLVRKSSLTLAALPPREPITTKKSLGTIVSRTSHLDQIKAGAARGSFLGRITGGKSLGGSKQPETTQAEDDDDVLIDKDPIEKPSMAREESDGDQKMTRLHNKSSTQLLHEKINMLGKSQLGRPTKSIPAAAAATQCNYPELPNQEGPLQSTNQIGSAAPSSATVPNGNDEDDDWIQPPQHQAQALSRPPLQKSKSEDVMEHIRGKDTISDRDFGLRKQIGEVGAASPLRSYDVLDDGRRSEFSQLTSPMRAGINVGANSSRTFVAQQPQGSNWTVVSTTPKDSLTSKRYVDGPLSASKSKLQSIMKTARGLFSSSAGVSAQAKMETLSPSGRIPKQQQEASIDEVSGHGAGTLGKYDSKGSPHKPSKAEASGHPTKANEGRKTRSSTEKEERRKEKEAKERHRAEAERQRDREHEDALQKQVQENDAAQDAPAKPLRQSLRKTQNTEASNAQSEITESDHLSQAMGPPTSHPHGRPSQMQRMKDVRRPVKPGKDAVPRAKAPPVNIRVGMPSQRVPLTNATLSSTLQESLPSTQSKQPAMTKKASNASLQSTTSNNNLKSSVNSAATKPKALIAAERKKEQVRLSLRLLHASTDCALG